MFCEACHGSTHALAPAMTWQDNVQAVTLQGTAGPLRTCTVCHLEQPKAAFRHRFFESKR